MRRVACLALLFFPVFALAGRADLSKLSADVREKLSGFLKDQRAKHGPGVDQLVPTRVEVKERQGLVRIQYEQFHDGVRVFGGYGRITLNNGNPAGRVEVVNDLDVPTTPTVTLGEAVTVAARQLLIAGTPLTSDSELLILPRDPPGKGRAADLLVWMFLISSEDTPQTVKVQRAWINAITGEVVGIASAAPHGKQTVHAPMNWRPYWGPGGGYSMFTPATLCKGGKCKTYAYHFDEFYAEDPCFGLGYLVAPSDTQGGYGTLMCASGADTNDGFVPAEGGNYVCDASNFMNTCKPMKHSVLDTHTLSIGDGIPGSQNYKTFVADAYTAMRLTFDYLWRVHGRQGLDGNNGPRIHIETRSPEIAGNVQWLKDKPSTTNRPATTNSLRA
jgi:hypothetical protein